MIEENIVAGNSEGGIGIVENTSEIVVRANQVKQNDGPGIIAKSVEEVDVPSRVTIEHNFVTENAGNGIEIGEEVAETVIRGNAVGQNTGASVHVYEGVDTTIDENDIDDNGREGVDLLAAKRVQLTRNEITGNDGDGVHVGALAEEITIGWAPTGIR